MFAYDMRLGVLAGGNISSEATKQQKRNNDYNSSQILKVREVEITRTRFMCQVPCINRPVCVSVCIPFLARFAFFVQLPSNLPPFPRLPARVPPRDVI